MKTRNIPPSPLRRQRGVTLVEISLGTIAILFVATYVLGGFDSIRDTIKAYREVNDFPKVLECIQHRKVTASNFAGTTTASVYSCFSNSMQSSGTAINYWQGPVTVGVATTTTANDSLTFTSANYSQHGCTAVGSGLATTFGSITANGTVVKTIGNPLNDGALEAACVAGSNNTLVFLATK